MNWRQYMKECLTIAILICSFFVVNARAQELAKADHEHMLATCNPVSAEKQRPEFGCFIVASAKGLQFSPPVTYWHLSKFPNRAAAEGVKTSSGLIVAEEGKVWLSEFGPKDAPLRGGEPVAVIGPLELPPAKSYTAEIAYAILRPGDRSRVHTHDGPEAWYVISGSQCLETPEGTIKVDTGKTMSVRHSIPMELSITGTEVRRSLTLVIHDSAKSFGTASDWKPTGACGK